MENNTIHKTSKGKIFQMVGANGKPIDYAENLFSEILIVCIIHPLCFCDI